MSSLVLRTPLDHAEGVAVVDIGSNSVRLVVYDGPARSPLPKYNEKILCGLGRGLAETGRLSQEAMVDALQTLTRFSELVRLMRVKRLAVVATAAVRDAENGPDFVREVRKRTGFEVTVLRGEEEARFAALGVMFDDHGATGFVGDLGGGSLELARLNGQVGHIGSVVSLPLGPQRLPAALEREALSSFIDARLKSVSWLEGMQGQSFHAVGGAWRALAKLHIERTAYPLHIVQNYTLDTQTVLELSEELSRLGREEALALSGVSMKRRAMMPVTALTLNRLLRLTRPERVVFSAHGLREGVLFDGLSERDQNKDPLVTACADMGRRENRFPGIGKAVFRWMAPLFIGESPEWKRLRKASAHISDVAWRLHPDYRDGQAYRRILRAPVMGVDHRQRCLLAMIVYARYSGGVSGKPMELANMLCSQDDIEKALRIGLALRLAHTLTGGVAAMLNRMPVHLDRHHVVLTLPGSMRAFAGAVVDRRLKALADAFGVESLVAFEAD